MNELYRAKIVRIDDDGVFVTIADLGEGNEWGPVETPPVALALGDSVVVGSVAGVVEDLVIVAKLTVVAAANTSIEAYAYANEAARTAAGLTPTMGMMTWIENVKRLDVWSSTSGSWVQHYGVSSGALLLPQGTKIGVGQTSPAAALDMAATASTDRFLGAAVSGDANSRFVQTADGAMAWGPGSAVRDTTLGRVGTGQLQISDRLGVGGVPAGTASYTARQATNRVGFFSNNTEAGIYHPLAHFYAIEAGQDSSKLLDSYKSGDAQPRFGIMVDGTMVWGPGGSSLTDTNLYRSGVNQIRTDSHLVVFNTVTSWGEYQSLGNLRVGPDLTDMGRGCIENKELTTSVPGISTTQTQVIAFSSFTYKAGRAYKLTISAGFTPSTSGAFADFRLFKTSTSGTTVAEFFRFPSSTASVVEAAHGTVTFKVGASDVTAVLVVGAATNTGTISIYGNTNGVTSKFWIEDIGAASKWNISTTLS